MEFEKLKKVIAEVLNVDPDEITMETTFMDDLGADSLDVFQIIMGIEEEFDIEIPSDVTLSEGNPATITTPDDLRWRDHWTLNWWWITKDIENDSRGSRVVIIQSQEGDPICMFVGNDVTWDVSRNLPKTTEICIDGKMVYIHRANYAIVDTSVFE